MANWPHKALSVLEGQQFILARTETYSEREFAFPAHVASTCSPAGALGMLDSPVQSSTHITSDQWKIWRIELVTTEYTGLFWTGLSRGLFFSFLSFFLFFLPFFLFWLHPACSCSMWTLYLWLVGSSFLTRDRTWAPCIGSKGVLASGPQGKSLQGTILLNM